MSKKPIETFGVFAIHRDGTVTTISGERPADIIASSLRRTRQTVEDDMIALSAFTADFERARERARTYAAGGAFRPLPLSMCYAPTFERGVDA